MEEAIRKRTWDVDEPHRHHSQLEAATQIGMSFESGCGTRGVGASWSTGSPALVDVVSRRR